MSNHPTVTEWSLRTYTGRFDDCFCARCGADTRGRRIALLPLAKREELVGLKYLKSKTRKYVHVDCLPVLMPQDLVPPLVAAIELLAAKTDPAWPLDGVGFSHADYSPMMGWARAGAPRLYACEAARRLAKYVSTQLGGPESDLGRGILTASAYCAAAVTQEVARDTPDQARVTQTQGAGTKAQARVTQPPSPPGAVLVECDGDSLKILIQPWTYPEHMRLKDELKRRGAAKWDAGAKVWRASPKQVALNWDVFEATMTAVNAPALALIDEIRGQTESRVALSGAAGVDDSDLEARLAGLFPPSLNLYPYQKAGVAFIEAAQGRALVGDEMGLGKTIQVIAYLALHRENLPALVVVPAVVAPNWEREFNTWLPEIKVQRLKSAADAVRDETQVVITTYGLWPRYGAEKARLRKALKSAAKKLVALDDLIQIEADPMPGTKPYLEQRVTTIKTWTSAEKKLCRVETRRDFVPRSVVADESHYLKNSKSLRTKALLKTCKDTAPAAILCLSGTPLINRPVEFYTTLNLLRPADWSNWFQYTKQFCDGHHEEVFIPGGHGEKKKVWVCSGASNLDELHRRLKDLMVRRMKKDVLPDLPEKVVIETIVELNQKERSAYNKAVAEAYAGVDPDEPGSHLVAITAARQAVGIAKVRATVEWVKEYVEQELPVLVFAHHKDVRGAIRAEIEVAEIRVDAIDGTVPQDKRQAVVDAFQAGKLDCLVISTEAGGVGITLTRASHVLISERSWTPGAEQQAADRSHRIGQENTVTVRVLKALDADIDEDMSELLSAKDEVIKAALDGTGAAPKSMDIRTELVERWAKRRR